ncbi:MAG TPA: cell division protein FtsQ [Ohtaekwangia sp.]|nr:cell division protein FtsQ [Ohtaekwangia sp.]
MKFKFNLKREIKIGAAIIVVLLFIGFTERKQAHVPINEITIRLENTEGNHFMEESDIAELMDVNIGNLKGADLDAVNLKAIEQKIKHNPFVEDADLYSDLKGNVIARVSLRRPVARIVRHDGPDGYIAEDGTLMPVSDKFTARVVLLSGPYVRQLLQQQNMRDTQTGEQLMELISRIRRDEFWNAQIAQLDIDGKAKITFFPQVGDERIEFGKPDEQEVKLRKLKIFYKEILPRVGWNKYARVNLEYAGQIIAE